MSSPRLPTVAQLLSVALAAVCADAFLAAPLAELCRKLPAPAGTRRVLVVELPAGDTRALLAGTVAAAAARGAAAIGVDVVLENADQDLERAVRASGRVVLATRLRHDGSLERIPVAGAALAVTPLVPDRDGVVRFLRHRLEPAGAPAVHSMILELLKLLTGQRYEIEGDVFAAGGGAPAVPIERDGSSWAENGAGVGTIDAARFVATAGEPTPPGGAVIIGATSGTLVIARDLAGRLAGSAHRLATGRETWALRAAFAVAGFAAAGAGAASALVLVFLALLASSAAWAAQVWLSPAGPAAAAVAAVLLGTRPRAAPAPVPVAAPPNGNALEARFADLSHLGAGGMSSVWTGTDRFSGQRVAIKVPAPEMVQDAGDRQRFMREMQLLMEIEHPNLVRIVGLHMGDPCYFAMELVEGETLVKRLARAGGRIPAADALALVAPVAAALAAIHDRGVVHRDVKPGNIVLAHDGRVVLIDLGLAFEADRSRLTEAGVAVGTPAYAAPEQLSGDPTTPAADVYAFGTMLFEMLAGERPFQDARLAVKCHRDAPSLAERMASVDPELAGFVDRCLARRAEDRPASGAALVGHLRRLRGEGGGTWA